MSLTIQQRGWVLAAAELSGIEFAVLAALVDKESDGKFFWDVGGRKLPALNIEGHRFYKYLQQYSPQRLDEAVKAGLASKKRQGIKVPGSYSGRYAFFDRMIAFHSAAAYLSVSVGVGQIMGENYKALGYESAKELFEDAVRSGENQVQQIVRFIQTKPPLAKAVHDRDVQGIAFYYNGPAYRTNQYDTKLAKLIDFYDGKATTPFDVEGAEAVAALGYDSIARFQAENGLKADGIAGKLTQAKIAEVTAARKKKAAKPAATAATVGGGAVGVIGTGAVVLDGAQNVDDVIQKAQPVIETVQSVGAISPKLVVVLVAALVVGVVAYVVIQKLRKR